MLDDDPSKRKTKRVDDDLQQKFHDTATSTGCVPADGATAFAVRGSTSALHSLQAFLRLP
jgi:hypothetical protein